MRIGLFDSGTGGLTVLKAFLDNHPENEYIYYGDTLNLPYGEKTIDELHSFAKKIISFLISKNVDIIVIACGTISANLYDVLKQEFDIPIYSVISEIPEYIEKHNYKNTLVLATSATINSHIYKRLIKTNVIEVACPKLVPIIESNDYSRLEEALDLYLESKDVIDSIILGCTHYPIIRKEIESKINNVDIIDIGEVLANKIDIKDSFYSIELYFTKDIDSIPNNVKKVFKKDIKYTII